MDAILLAASKDMHVRWYNMIGCFKVQAIIIKVASHIISTLMARKIC